MTQNTMTTLYIRPALTDQAGQCRIYEIDSHLIGRQPISDLYQAKPDLFKEVGLMNSSGKVVCFAGPDPWYRELVDCQPLMAGMCLEVSEPAPAAAPAPRRP